jgi:molybdate transport system substrate-binding protein
MKASYRSMRCHSTKVIVLALALIPASPSTATAQLNVIISGGFSTAYKEVLPTFERTTGIKVTTGSGASQGSGPETIGAQLRRGVPADVVILSREGLNELIADGKIALGSDVNLAQTLIGIAVRAGAGKPDIRTVESFKQTMLRAKTIAMPGSTSSVYLTKELFPKLGIDKDITLKMTARGAESVALVAKGEAALAIQPVSELLHVAGVDFVGPIPSDVQRVAVFAAGVVKDSKSPAFAKQLIAFLASDAATAAIKNSGMERSGR